MSVREILIDGKINSDYIDAVNFPNIDISQVNGLQADLTNLQDQIDDVVDSKGQPNGICPLNGAGQIDPTYLDPSVFTFEGPWNALTNTPTLVDGVGNTGDLYIVSVGGTQFTPSIDFLAGDFVCYANNKWAKIASGASIESIVGGTNITVSQLAGNYTISAPNVYNKTETDTLLNNKVENATNQGTGEGTIFKNKTTTNLNFKSIKAGTGLTIANNTDDITINANAFPASGVSASNVGHTYLTGVNVQDQLDDADSEIVTLNLSKVNVISNTDGKITIDNTVPVNPIVNLDQFYRWGNGSYRGLVYEHRSPTLNGSQIAFNASITASITTCNIGWDAVNRGFDSDIISSLKSLWTYLRDNLPVKIRLVDVTNDASYFTLNLTSLLGTGAFGYSFNCVNVPTETTANTTIPNGQRYYLVFDFTNKTYINAQDQALQTQITTLNTNKIDTINNTDTFISVTGSGASRTINLVNPLPSQVGGLGLNTFARGDLIQCVTAPNTLGRLAAVATGNALISGGVGAVSTWGKIGLTTHVSGTLAVASGGTNITSYVTGDILIATGTSTLSRLGSISVGNCLLSGGTGVSPFYGKVTLANHVSGILAIINGGHGSNNINQARQNLAHDRNTTRDIILDLLKHASTFSINPNWEGDSGSAGETNFNLGLGFLGSPGASYDNLIVLRCIKSPINMKGLFYKEYRGTGFKTKWCVAYQFNHTADLSGVLLGMCTDEYINKARQNVDTNTAIRDGTNNEPRNSFKWSVCFNGTGGLRRYDDGAAGNSASVTRFGFTANSLGQGNAVLILSQESPTTVCLHWYNITNATTLTYVSHMIVTLPYADVYQHNGPSSLWHPCLSYLSTATVVTGVCERWLAQYVTINQGGIGIYNPASYYNIIY